MATAWTKQPIEMFYIALDSTGSGLSIMLEQSYLLIWEDPLLLVDWYVQTMRTQNFGSPFFLNKKNYFSGFSYELCKSKILDFFYLENIQSPSYVKIHQLFSYAHS